MAGAIVGARNGLDSLPWDLVYCLNDNGYDTGNDMSLLVEQLLPLMRGKKLGHSVMSALTVLNSSGHKQHGR